MPFPARKVIDRTGQAEEAEERRLTQKGRQRQRESAETREMCKQLHAARISSENDFGDARNEALVQQGKCEDREQLLSSALDHGVSSRLTGPLQQDIDRCHEELEPKKQEASQAAERYYRIDKQFKERCPYYEAGYR